MAGMISMINNRLWEERCKHESSKFSRDNSNSTRSAQRSVTPLMNRRNFKSNLPTKRTAGRCKDFDSLPKGWKKKKKYYIHPMLRRGVCTLLCGGVVVMTGVVWILLGHLFFFDMKRTVGLGLLISGFLVTMLGIIWSCTNWTKLKKLKERKARKHEKRVQKQMAVYDEATAQALMIRTSGHAAGWPKKSSAIVETDMA